jgi:ATP-dependent RNA helicase DeaD
VYGGEDIRKQLKELDQTPQVLVATPGRLIDLMNRGKVRLNNVNYLVLDEADEMLNMGFVDDITEILQETPDTRRTLLFSATMPQEIANIAKNYMHDAHEIAVGKRGEAAQRVEHRFVLIKNTMRYEALKRILDFYPDIYGIVFCRTRMETKEVAEKLMIDGYNADALHGDLSQSQRDAVMNKFRIKHLQILVATDVAARGLDVNDLTHVIHYVLPDDKETYTHRSGRTGRVNKEGISIALVTPREKMSIKSIEKAIKRNFEPMEIPSGMAVCQRQMQHLLAQMAEVTMHPKLHKLLPDAYEILKDVSKEELIAQLISVRFNPLLQYYENAPDLQAVMRKEPKEEVKPSRRQMRQADKGDTLRLKINKGKNDKMDPRRLLGLLNDVVGDRTLTIGDIDISAKFTFFDVPKNRVEQVFVAFETSKRARGIQIALVKGTQGSQKSKVEGQKSKVESQKRKPRRG